MLVTRARAASPSTLSSAASPAGTSAPGRPTRRALGFQVRSDRDKFVIYLDVKHFSPEDLTVKVLEDFVEIHGKHNERQVSRGHRRLAPTVLRPCPWGGGLCPHLPAFPEDLRLGGDSCPLQMRGLQGRPLGDCPWPLLPDRLGGGREHPEMPRANTDFHRNRTLVGEPRPQGGCRCPKHHACSHAHLSAAPLW